MALSHAPTTALIQELRRRGVDPVKVAADGQMPGLTIRPSRNQVVWRGQTAHVTGRMMEVLLVLAKVYPSGLRTEAIGRAVWDATYEPKSNAAANLCYLRRRLPGLLASRRGGPSGTTIHWLWLTDQDRPYGA